MQADVSALIRDTDHGAQTATYCARDAARAYDPRSATVARTETQTTVTALIAPLTEKQIRDGGGAYRRGDVQVLITTDDLAAAPRPEDRITTSTATFVVLEVVRPGVDTHHHLIAREA